MKKQFNFYGELVDDDLSRWCVEDTTPQMVDDFLKSLNDDDEIEFTFSSPGGSVSSGVAIANKIKNCGKKTKAIIDGVCASSATIVASACDEIVMNNGSFFMIHNPWMTTYGDSDQLKKDAEVLDKMKASLISFYKSKFDKSDEEISKMMDEETWISTLDYKDFGLKCTVVESDHEFKVAACSKMPKFMKAPENFKNLIKIGEKKNADNPKNSVEVPSVKDRDDSVSTSDNVVKKEEMITVAECEKRVQGMQSTMQKQINDLKKDYESKINEFKNQLQTKDEELNNVNSKFTNLQKEFDDCKMELSKKTSALAEKETALTQLNVNVNKYQTSTNPLNDWKKLKGKEFLDFVAKHQDELSKLTK